MAAESKIFATSVVTPERVVVECDARFVALPAHDGEVGILAQRAPLLTRLGAGALRIETTDGGTRSFFVDGGFAEMVANRLTVLTESALPADQLTREGAKELMAQAEAMESLDEASYSARQRTLRKARAQLRMLG